MYTQTAEQAMLRDSIRRFMKSEVAPIVARHDQEKTFPFELLKPLSEFGYLGGRLSEEEGGMGLDQLTWAMLMEEAGYAWLSLRTILNITNAAINKLAAEATPAQKERFLKPLLNNERRCFSAISEPGTGSNIAQVQTRADLQGDHYVLNGRKLWITNGAFGDFGIVVARTFSPDCQGQLSTFLVERDVSPYEMRRVDTMVLRSTGTAELGFDNVKVPRENLLGEEGGALKKMLIGLDSARVNIAMGAVGAAQSALDLSIDYARTRTQFGKPIGSFQALQHRCVDMFIHLEVAKATLDEVLALSAQGLPAQRLEAEASRVNARCTAAALQASRASVQLHGAVGYTQECDLSLFYKRVLCLSAWLGNASAHQRRHAVLSGDAEAAPGVAGWNGEFPRTADWSAMPEADFRRMVRAFLQQRYPQQLRYLSHRARWSEMREWYLTLSAQGWIAPAWPQSHGGMGLPADKLIAWIEELEQYGVARAPDQGIVMIGPLLIQHGTPQQQQRFLPRILSGEHVWCQGYSEPNAGSDLAGLRTEAMPARDAQGEHFIVNGQKIWTTLAQDANHIFMLVRTDKDARKQEGISFLLCDLRTPGITIRPIHTLAGEPEFCEVFFDNVRVPAENLVGRLHGGWSIAKALLGFERIFLGSPKQSQYALGQLARLAQARRLFADPVFAQRFAALRLDVLDLSASYTGFANIVRAGKPLPASVSLLKIWASETYHRIGALLVEAGEEQGAVAGDQVLDGQTFNVLSPLIGSTAAMIYGGTNEIQRNILARQVLDLPA